MAAQLPSITSRDMLLIILAYVVSVTIGDTEMEDPAILIKDNHSDMSKAVIEGQVDLAMCTL